MSIRSETTFEFAVINKVFLQTGDEIGPVSGWLTINTITADGDTDSFTFSFRDQIADILTLLNTHKIGANLLELVGKVVVIDKFHSKYIGPLAGVGGYRRPVVEGGPLPDGEDGG